MFSRQKDYSSDIQELKLKMQQVEKDNDKMDKALERLEQIYVRVEEFRPIKTIIYGAVGLILMGVAAAALSIIGLS